jgi:hypothetical protein
MRRFFRNTGLFALLFFLLEKLLYVFLIISPSRELDTRLERVIKGELNKEIIILGSSRGARNIIAGQMEDSLGKSVFNLSYPGSDIEFHEFLLRSLLRFDQKPEKILLAVDDSTELLANVSTHFRLDRMYPLAKYNYINDEMIARGEKNILSRFFVAARINKANFDLRRKHFIPMDTMRDCGSLPVSFQKKNSNLSQFSPVLPYHKENEQLNKRKAFYSFQKLCLQNHIELILVFPPNFQQYNRPFENRLRDLTRDEVKFMVYDTLNPVYQDSAYFHDEFHLQTKGAVIFTNEIIAYLKAEKISPH